MRTPIPFPLSRIPRAFTPSTPELRAHLRFVQELERLPMRPADNGLHPDRCRACEQLVHEIQGARR